MTPKTENCAFAFDSFEGFQPANTHGRFGILIGILSLFTFPFFCYTQFFGFGFCRQFGI